MLKKLRDKKTAKRIWIILAVLILPAFILWGSGSIIGKDGEKKSSFAGKVQGRNIPLSEYQDAIDATRAQAILQFGDRFSEIQEYLNLESQAWDRIVLLAEAKKRKINADDKEVVELIGSYPFFQRKNIFDNKLYVETLKYGFNTQPRIFEEQTRQNIILSKLFKELTGDIKISEEEVKKQYEETNEQISLYYIAAIPFDFMDKDAKIDETEIKAYFENNKLQFKQPLSYNLEYIAVDSQDKINRLTPHLNKKEPMDKTLKDMELALKETGLFSETAPIPGIGWSSQVSGLLSGAKTGEYLTPVQIDKAFYIFRLKERKEPSIPEFDKIKNNVKEILIRHKAEVAAKIKIEACLEKLKTDAESTEFDKIAKEFGLKSSSTDLFKFNSYIEGIGASDVFWTTGKKLKDNEISDIISLPSGFYIVKLKSRPAIDENKFKEEKGKVTQQLLMQKKQEYFGKFTADLVKNSQHFQ